MWNVNNNNGRQPLRPLGLHLEPGSPPDSPGTEVTESSVGGFLSPEAMAQRNARLEARPAPVAAARAEARMRRRQIRAAHRADLPPHNVLDPGAHRQAVIDAREHRHLARVAGRLQEELRHFHPILSPNGSEDGAPLNPIIRLNLQESPNPESILTEGSSHAPDVREFPIRALFVDDNSQVSHLTYSLVLRDTQMHGHRVYSTAVPSSGPPTRDSDLGGFGNLNLSHLASPENRVGSTIPETPEPPEFPEIVDHTQTPSTSVLVLQSPLPVAAASELSFVGRHRRAGAGRQMLARAGAGGPEMSPTASRRGSTDSSNSPASKRPRSIDKT